MRLPQRLDIIFDHLRVNQMLQLTVPALKQFFIQRLRNTLDGTALQADCVLARKVYRQMFFEVDSVRAAYADFLVIHIHQFLSFYDLLSF